MKFTFNNTTIHYEVFGEGKPLLALHGWTLDHNYMMNIIEPSFIDRDGWKRYYIDLPGHGKSIGSNMLKSGDDVLEILLAFIDSQFNGKKFAVAGFSFGGVLARGLIGKRSDQVAGLFVIAPDIEHGSDKEELPPRTLLVRNDEVVAELQPQERDLGLFQMTIVDQSFETLSLMRKYIFPPYSKTNREYLSDISDKYMTSIDETILSEPYNRPALLLMGRQDNLTGYRNVWSIIENYPRATFAVLDCAGHHVGGVERVGVSRALISDWIDRMEEDDRI